MTAGLDVPTDDALDLPSARAVECWADEDRAELVCCQILEITHDVKTFVFEAPDRSVFHFDPGQFVTLEVEVGGETLTRCYTISSPPTRPYRLSITVKRVIDGPVSNHLHDHLTVGATVTVAAPLGRFSLVHHPAPKYLFLSAGSGITPLMSMTRTLYDLGTEADVVFVHSARTPADIVFRRELDAMAATTPHLQVIHICEGDYPADRWTGLRGRLSTTILTSVVPDLAERKTFTCGPAAYMEAARRIVEEAGLPMGNYHEESFSFEDLSAPERPEIAVEALEALDQAEDDAPAVTTFTVEFARTGQTVTCAADQYVLDAALAAGLRPPSSCSQGMCGTCKTTLLAGQVDMQHNGGIRPREVAQDKVLICCSKPLSDLRIDS